MLIAFHEYTIYKDNVKSKRVIKYIWKKNTKQEDSDDTKEEDNSL